VGRRVPSWEAELPFEPEGLTPEGAVAGRLPGVEEDDRHVLLLREDDRGGNPLDSAEEGTTRVEEGHGATPVRSRGHVVGRATSRSSADGVHACEHEGGREREVGPINLGSHIDNLLEYIFLSSIPKLGINSVFR
jgi:hypothetical protein